MNEAGASILVVDDERVLCAGVQEALKREGYSVDTAHDVASALSLATSGCRAASAWTCLRLPVKRAATRRSS